MDTAIPTPNPDEHGSQQGPPILLFQFWHSGTPPDDVAVLIEEWQSAPGFDHRLYDYQAALALIEAQLGDRVASCFAACAVPAMQADLFRYVALYTMGGAYLDADIGCGEANLSDLLTGLPVGLLCRKPTKDQVSYRLINDICFVRDSDHPLFLKLIDIACDKISAREETDVWSVTGPWLLNLVRKSPDASLLDGFHHEWYDDIKKYVRPVGKLAYKQGPDDWRRHYKAGRSLYRSDPPT